jgi:hypothetical protein
MRLNVTRIELHTGKHLSDALPIENDLKQGDALSPQLLIFAVEYTNRRAQEHKD